ncbi:MAG TPA: bifunctional tetrahydrofolate synthase/dihydrofolate synthase [Usitatibacter sp.]|nr:bifunctional tetrahydrofolate synthase/dihydrofolate synthase [Usitatibacter sp.]
MTRGLEAWLAHISAQHPATIALGLDRVLEVAGRMEISLALGGGPGRGSSTVVITVGGTNGKGSTCAFLERILIEAGYRVGLYTSPHLLRYNERVRIGGEDASDQALVESFERVEAARGETLLTYFEFGTLSALWLFERAELDAVILEVGLGGRLDAVNIVDADASIVVSVDLDHQAFLGNDREAIGFEKAGIYRAGRPAIFGGPQPPQRLEQHAREIGAELLRLGVEFRYEAQERQWDFIGVRGNRRALPIPALRGGWQLANASCALMALETLEERLPVSLGEVKRGLANVRLPGRLQVLPGRPAVVLDVAHNPHAARSLASGLGDMGFFENTIAVFGVLADKDIAGVIEEMKGRIDRWHVAAPLADRAASAATVANVLAEKGLGEATRSFTSIESALDTARRDAGPNDRIVVFGSFYTVAEALRSSR